MGWCHAFWLENGDTSKSTKYPSKCHDWDEDGKEKAVGLETAISSTASCKSQTSIVAGASKSVNMNYLIRFSLLSIIPKCCLLNSHTPHLWLHQECFAEQGQLYEHCVYMVSIIEYDHLMHPYLCWSIVHNHMPISRISWGFLNP